MKRSLLFLLPVLHLAACYDVPEREVVHDRRGSIDARAIFLANCASCHNPLKDATGPALNDRPVAGRSDEWLLHFLFEREKVRGDSLLQARVKKYGMECLSHPKLTRREYITLITALRSAYL